MENYKIITAQTPNDFKKGKELFIEYAKSKKFDLSYQKFDKELIEIETQYGLPDGKLLLILDNHNNYIGCGGIKKFKDFVAELKRMYIKKEFRGKGLGKKLLEKLIESARDLQYEKIWLDTLESLPESTSLYRKYGFSEQEPYRFNPNPDVLYFELEILEDNH